MIFLQVASRLLLTIIYVCSGNDAFNSVEMIMEESIGRHLPRYFHANLCSYIFLMIIIHVGKRMYYKSSNKANL